MTVTVARQMIGAELLKLRRNRGLMGLAFLLSVVMVTFVFIYLAVQHGSDPQVHGPAGGSAGLHTGLRVLGLLFGTLSAALIGAEAGTADISSGVFRDLVATGRSRLALFAVRLPAALIVTWGFTAAAYAIAVLASFVFADGRPTPTLGQILDGVVWLAAAYAVTVALAVGMGSITGSRGLTLTAVIGWQTVATEMLVNTNSLGSVRDWLVLPALGQLMPIHSQPLNGITMATGTAVFVLVAWAVVPTALGAWRTRTRDA